MNKIISRHLFLPLPSSAPTRVTDSFIAMATEVLRIEMKTQGGPGKPLEDILKEKKMGMDVYCRNKHLNGVS